MDSQTVSSLDSTVEHFGDYELQRVAVMPVTGFHEFVPRTCGAMWEEMDRINQIDRMKKD